MASAVAPLVMRRLLAVIAVLVRRDWPGGVLLNQTRTLRRGTPFRMPRFRTMRADAEQGKAQLAVPPLRGTKVAGSIMPGLTSLWQINGRSNLGWDESVRLDLYYVENWSVTGDLQIRWRTFKAMVQPEGAY